MVWNWVLGFGIRCVSIVYDFVRTQLSEPARLDWAGTVFRELSVCEDEGTAMCIVH